MLGRRIEKIENMSTVRIQLDVDEQAESIIITSPLDDHNDVLTKIYLVLLKRPYLSDAINCNEHLRKLLVRGL